MARPIITRFLVFALYLAAAILITYPLITQLNTRLLGHPFGDTYEYTRHIWAIHQALRTGVDPFFQPLLMYPNGLSGAWLWSVPLQSFPQVLLLFIMPLPIAHNLTALATLALNGLAMWVFLSSELRVMGDERRNHHASLVTLFPSLLGGLIFMTYPSFMGQLGIGHTGLLVLYPVPLLAWALLRLDVSWRTRRLGGSIVLCAFFFVLSLLGSNLILIYLTLPVTAIIFLRWLVWRRYAALRRGLVAVGIGILFALPFVLPALNETVNAPAALREDASVRFSADLLGIVSPSFYNPLYGGIAYNRAVLGVDPFEGAAYIGLFTAALCLIGVWRARGARWWLLLAVAAWAFSLGAVLKIFGEPAAVIIDGRETMISLPYALLSHLPILNLARTPARFNFAVGFAAAVMAGYGAAAVLAWIGRRTSGRVGASRFAPAGAALLLAGLIVLDARWYEEIPSVSAEIPPEIAALAERDDIRAVFDVPFEHLLVDKDAMYLQTAHEHPLIAGHIARRTPLDPAIGWLLQGTLDPALLNAAGADVIILHKQWDDEDGALDALLRERLGMPFYEDEMLAVFEVPASAAPPQFLVFSNLPPRLSQMGEVYFYAPQDGSAMLTGSLRSTTPLEVAISLDGEPLAHVTVHGDMPLNIPLSFSAGYHTVTLALAPPCPANAGVSDSAACAVVHLADTALIPVQ